METTRMKITVKEVLPSPEKWKDKLSKFMGADGITYDCWHKTIVPFLIAGKILDVDMKVEDKNGYQHHEIVQLYDNGQAVFNQKQGFGGGFRGKSPEEIAATNKSIEEQTAFKGGVELMIAGKASVRIIAVTERWLLIKLGGKLIMSPDESDALFNKDDKPPVPKPAEQTPPVVETVKPKRDVATIKNWGDLCDACRIDFKMSRSEVLKELGVSDFKSFSGVGEQSPSACYETISAIKQ
jgi:hypothetical protein